MSYRRRCNLPRVNPHNVIVHRPRIHKGVMVNHSHAVRHPLIDVGNVGDVIDGHVVVNVCDLRDVHARVADIDILYVARARPVPRNEYFSRRQWKPSHAASTAHSDTDAKAAAANEGDQRR
jgi:hypothetical protein